MALAGIRVLELAGLAPGPFCGMILADFGAQVIRVDRVGALATVDRLCRGKQSIAVNLKKDSGREVVRRLAKSMDVVIEPYRRGVMERMGLGPDRLLKENPRLIYARLTGYGQSGSLADRAGHDINYLAISGVLSRLGRAGDRPMPPINLLADFGGGGLMCAMGILMALVERFKSGQGQVIDANMVEGAAYLSTFLWTSSDMPGFWSSRGQGVLDGGAHCYDTYETKDNKFVAVGALETNFYEILCKVLDLDVSSLNQLNQDDRPRLAAIFKSKTRDEWEKLLNDVDACVTPILEMDEAPRYAHNAEKQAFFEDGQNRIVPRPSPRLGRNPFRPSTPPREPNMGEHTRGVLIHNGFSEKEVEALLKEKAIGQTDQQGSKL